MSSKAIDDKFNIMLIGDDAVGKTAIIERYCKNLFSCERKKTGNIDNHKVERDIKDKRILIKIWDTVGQQKYTDMAKSHFKIAHGILLVCAVDNKESFNHLTTWVECLHETCDMNRTKMVLIANKIDLNNERVVTTEELTTFGESIFSQVMETSAKDNIGIKEGFEKLIGEIYEMNYSKDKGFDLSDGNHSSKGKLKCCN